MSESNRWPVYQGRVVDLGLESFALPNGELLTLEIVRHPGGAVTAALDGDSRVCLLRQYRHAAGGWIWELPAGLIEEEESPRTTAERELLEEAGVHAARWESLGQTYSSPGFCTEQLHLFLARDLSLEESFTARDDEVIEVHWRPFAEALDMAAEGEIHDGKTIAALFRASRVL